MRLIVDEYKIGAWSDAMVDEVIQKIDQMTIPKGPLRPALDKVRYDVLARHLSHKQLLLSAVTNCNVICVEEADTKLKYIMAHADEMTCNIHKNTIPEIYSIQIPESVCELYGSSGVTLREADDMKEALNWLTTDYETFKRTP